MSGYIEGAVRGQTVLFPNRLDDWIDEDQLVRALGLFDEELDLADLGFGRAAHARTGQPCYHLAALLKLIIYGYLNLIPSSRRLEREAGVRSALRDRAAKRPQLPIPSTALIATAKC